MGWTEFIASIVKSTAWPAVVVVTIVLFQRPIKELITSISELKIGKDGVIGKWDRTSAEVWEGLRKTPSEPYLGEREKLTFAPSKFAFDDQSPNVVRISAAWSQLEQALRARLPKDGDADVEKGPAELVEEAAKRGVITSIQAKSLRGLYALRNLAAHSGDSDVSDARVNEYLAMADAMKMVLDIID